MLWVHDGFMMGFMMGSCMVPLSFGLWTLPALPWLKSERWYWVSSPSSWQLHWSPPGCSWQVTSPPSVDTCHLQIVWSSEMFGMQSLARADYMDSTSPWSWWLVVTRGDSWWLEVAKAPHPSDLVLTVTSCSRQPRREGNTTSDVPWRYAQRSTIRQWLIHTDTE